MENGSCAVVGVATLLLQFGERLIEALQCDWAREELPNAQEQAKALRLRNEQLEAQLKAMQAVVARAVDAHRKAHERAQGHIAAKAAAVAEACRKLQAKLSENHDKDIAKEQREYNASMRRSWRNSKTRSSIP